MAVLSVVLLIAVVSLAAVVALVVAIARRPTPGKVIGLVALILGGMFVFFGLFFVSYQATPNRRAMVERRIIAGREARYAEEADLMSPISSSGSVEAGSSTGEPHGSGRSTGSASANAPEIRPPAPLPLDDVRGRGIVTVAVPRDLERWQRDSVLGFRPEDGDSRPQWVADAAGAEEPSYGFLAGTRFEYSWPRRGQLVGYSGKEASPSDAMESARESAAHKLAVLALIQLKRETPDTFDAKAAEPLARRLSRGLPPVAHEFYETSNTIVGSPFEVDAAHLEKARLSYGDVYRAAVLVEASDQDVQRIAGLVRREIERGWLETQQTVKTWIFTGFSVLALAFAVFLIYSFLNAGTKGHFAWILRAASLVVFVAVCAAILYLRGRMAMF